MNVNVLIILNSYLNFYLMKIDTIIIYKSHLSNYLEKKLRYSNKNIILIFPSILLINTYESG